MVVHVTRSSRTDNQCVYRGRASPQPEVIEGDGSEGLAELTSGEERSDSHILQVKKINRHLEKSTWRLIESSSFVGGANNEHPHVPLLASLYRR